MTKDEKRSAKYDIIETAAGWVGIEVSEQGVRKLTLPADNRGAMLAQMGITENDLTPGAGGGLGDRLKRFFSGEPVVFQEPFDLSGTTDFQRQVYEAACRIPYGQTVSYGELARTINKPGGARAVGRALGANPLPVIIPCHRIVGSDGSLTGFSGGLNSKKRLLQMEQNSAAP